MVPRSIYHVFCAKFPATHVGAKLPDSPFAGVRAGIQHERSGADPRFEQPPQALAKVRSYFGLERGPHPRAQEEGDVDGDSTSEGGAGVFGNRGGGFPPPPTGDQHPRALRRSFQIPDLVHSFSVTLTLSTDPHATRFYLNDLDQYQKEIQSRDFLLNGESFADAVRVFREADAVEVVEYSADQEIKRIMDDVANKNESAGIRPGDGIRDETKFSREQVRLFLQNAGLPAELAAEEVLGVGAVGAVEKDHHAGALRLLPGRRSDGSLLNEGRVEENYPEASPVDDDTVLRDFAMDVPPGVVLETPRIGYTSSGLGAASLASGVAGGVSGINQHVGSLIKNDLERTPGAKHVDFVDVAGSPTKVVGRVNEHRRLGLGPEGSVASLMRAGGPLARLLKSMAKRGATARDLGLGELLRTARGGVGGRSYAKDRCEISVWSSKGRRWRWVWGSC